MKSVRVVFGVALLASPVVGAWASEFAEAFKETWGVKLKAVVLTRDTADDLVLARAILDAARDRDQPAGLGGYLCEQAFALASKDPEGLSIAIDAMGVRGALLPGTRADCAEKALSLGQRQFIGARADEKPAAGDRLIDILLAQSEVWSQSGDYDKAAMSLKRAGFTAGGIKSPRMSAIAAASQILSHRQKSAPALSRHLAKLKANPGDREAALGAARLYTIDFDQPLRAAEFAGATGDKAWSEHLQLVVMCEAQRKELTELQYLHLAEWYRSHSAKAPGPVAGPMLQRSYSYYQQFVIRRPPTDPERQKVEMAVAALADSMRKLNVEVPESPLVEGVDAKPRRRASFFGIEVK